MALDLAKIQQALTARKTLRQRQAGKKEVLNLDPLRELPLLTDLRLTGFEDEQERQLKIADHLLRKAGRQTLRPLLPLLLQLKGRPYSLIDHFPFEPMFRTRVPKALLMKCGRQVSKSTSLAAQGVIFSNCIPHFSTLYITPLFEMIRRFSQNYVRPFIETSPLGRLFTGSTTVNSVLQKTFHNNAQMHFSFAYLDAERTRGISADKNVIDEVQDVDISFLPVIHETMSGSEDWGLKQYSGTPKTLDNTIEQLWLDSSMAEWMVPCKACGKENYPCLDQDLVEMIGPWRPDISEERPGIICAKCKRPVFPREGRWVHRNKELRWSFAGYHVPQIIMPMHYRDPERWESLVGKMNGRGNTPPHVFFNEVCGESFDSGSKMVTVTDLRKAAVLPWENKLEDAKKHIYEYGYRFCAVDWGGGGASGAGRTRKAEDKYRSYTSIAVLGLSGNGEIHVLYGFRSMHPHAHEHEAKIILGVMHHFQCSHLVHDYTGAGAVHETIVHQAGLPTLRIIPVMYTGAVKGNIFKWQPATDLHPRNHWKCDKPRSLNLTCTLIKSGGLKFFQYDHKGHSNSGLLHDFLHLIEDKFEGATGLERYRILHDPAGPDDFAQAVNIGTMAMFQMTKKWPDLALRSDLKITDEVIHSNPTRADWVDM